MSVLLRICKLEASMEFKHLNNRLYILLVHLQPLCQTGGTTNGLNATDILLKAETSPLGTS